MSKRHRGVIHVGDVRVPTWLQREFQDGSLSGRSVPELVAELLEAYFCTLEERQVELAVSAAEMVAHDHEPDHRREAADLVLHELSRRIFATRRYGAEENAQVVAAGVELDARVYRDPFSELVDPLEGIDFDGEAVERPALGLAWWEAEHNYRLFGTDRGCNVNVTGRLGIDGRSTMVFATSSMIDAISYALASIAYRDFPGLRDANVFIAAPATHRRKARL